MKQFSLEYEGMHMSVEFDQGALFWYRARFVIDGYAVDQKGVFAGMTRLRSTRPRPMVADATAGFFAGPKKVVLRDGDRVISFAKDT